MKQLNILMAMAILALIFHMNCKKDNASANTSWEVVQQGKTPDEPEVYYRTDTIIEEEQQNGELWECTTTTVDWAIAPEKFNNFDPNAEVIVPGMALEGASLNEATPKRIPFPAGKSAVSISTLTGCVAQAELEDASISKVYGAMNQIIATCPNTVTANFDSYFKGINTEEELQIGLKANLNVFGFFKSKAEFKFSSNENSHHFLVVLDQLYYTMVFERPSEFNKFFREDVTPTDLVPHIYPGNPAVYISSVSYGAKFYLLVEAEEDKDTIASSICASFSLFGGGCGSVKKISELKNVKISAYAIGGKADELIQAAMSTNVDDVRTYLSRSVDIRNGAPISYVARSILTDDVVKNGVAVKYSLKTCKPISVTNENLLAWYVGNENSIEFISGNTSVDKWKDKSGHNNHATYVSNSGFRPYWDDDGLNGNGAIVIDKAFTNAPPPFGGPIRGSVINFPGDELKNSDYTLVAVLGVQDDSVLNVSSTFALPEGKGISFIEGSGNYGYTNLGIFFRNDSIFFSNNSRANEFLNVYDASFMKCRIPNEYIDGFRVFTFRFSKSEGMSIFINGVKIAENNSLTTALNSFSGAHFGSSWLSLYSGPPPYPAPQFFWGQILIGEFKAFDKSLTDNAIKYLSEELIIKYGL